MAKPLFQDIIPPDKRSIKRIGVPDRSSRRAGNTTKTPVSAAPARHVPIPDDEKEEVEEEQYSEPVSPKRRSSTARTIKTVPLATRIASPNFTSPPTPEPIKKIPERIPFYEERDPYRTRFPWKAIIVGTCALLIIGGVYIFLSRFAKATVSLTPKTLAVTLNNSFIGEAVNATSTSSIGKIPFQIITLTKDGAMTVESTGQTTIQNKASGQIIVFNNYSTTPQKLIAGTRFATPSGLIFRSSNAVTIPGKKGTTPGNVTITVTADKPGDQYNIGLTDFVIPGLSGTPAYKDMYARSKTAMAGGFAGVQPSVNVATVAATQATIDAELEGGLLQQVRQQIPANQIFLPNAYVVSYQHLATTAASSSQAIIHEEGTIHAIAFDSAALASAFASTVNNSTDSNITWQISNPSELVFALNVAPSNSTEIGNLPTLPFKVSGTANLTAVVDLVKLKENLVGKPKTDFNPILSAFPGVTRATMSIQPFWRQTFPTDPSNIKITLSP